MRQKAASEIRARSKALAALAGINAGPSAGPKALEGGGGMLDACRLVGGACGIRFLTPPRWAAEADGAEGDLEQTGGEAQQAEQDNDFSIVAAMLHMLDGKGGEHRRGRGAGRGDKALGAAEGGRHQTEGGGAEDAGEGALGGKRSAQRQIDGDAEGNRRG